MTTPMHGHPGCATCGAPLPPVTTRGTARTYCDARCRRAAEMRRAEIAFWERTVTAWEPIDNPRQLAWCRERLERAKALPAAFFLDPANRWALRI